MGGRNWEVFWSVMQMNGTEQGHAGRKLCKANSILESSPLVTCNALNNQEHVCSCTQIWEVKDACRGAVVSAKQLLHPNPFGGVHPELTECTTTRAIQSQKACHNVKLTS